ncbi:MAG TPA: hypothetical protein VMZ29_15720 [Candidatus Bathyarchaeia archaeon]|nr:hypothetical protein [Candidatus Bathyarchaeia archaeon]
MPNGLIDNYLFVYIGVGKQITMVKKFRPKLIILSDPSVTRDFFLNNKLIIKPFTQSNRNLIGIDIYSTEWKQSSEKIEFQFLIYDINTAPEFDKTLNSSMLGGSGCIIIYDYTQLDIILQLEKWILETILVCGNIPILLLGKNYQENKLEKNVTDIKALVMDKQDSWNLSILNINVIDTSSVVKKVIDNLYNTMFDRVNNPTLSALQDGTIKNLTDLITHETNIFKIYHILAYIYKNNVASAQKLVYSLTIAFFSEFILKQEHLTDIPKVLITLNYIDSLFSKKLLKELPFENLVKKIKQEKTLTEIILLFSVYKIIDSKLWKKFLQTITSNLLTTKISQVWIEVAIIAEGTHSTIVELVQTVDGATSISTEIIRYVSETEQKRKIAETLNEIGTILAILFSSNKDQTIEIIENVPIRIRELALKVIHEEKNGKEKIDEKESLKASIEIGEFSKKEAAKKEIHHTLSELALIITCLEQLSNEKDRMNFINKISLDNIYSKIKDEKQLTTIVKLLKLLNEIDTNLTITLLRKITDILVERIVQEPSIIIINNLLEFVEIVDPIVVLEIISNYNTESLVNKIILFYAELELEQLDIPLLTEFAVNYGREGQFTLIKILHHLFPKVPQPSLTILLELLFELLEIVKTDSVENNSIATNQLMKIYDIFIETKLDEINKLLELVTQSLLISTIEIKEVFLSQLMTEAKEDFTYEKNKLFNFVQSLPE